MKITVETEYEIQAVEFKNTDVDIDQIVSMFRGMLCGLQFHGIDQYLKTSEEIDAATEHGSDIE